MYFIHWIQSYQVVLIVVCLVRISLSCMMEKFCLPEVDSQLLDDLDIFLLKQWHFCSTWGITVSEDSLAKPTYWLFHPCGVVLNMVWWMYTPDHIEKWWNSLFLSQLWCTNMLNYKKKRSNIAWILSSKACPYCPADLIACVCPYCRCVCGRSWRLWGQKSLGWRSRRSSSVKQSKPWWLVEINTLSVTILRWLLVWVASFFCHFSLILLWPFHFYRCCLSLTDQDRQEGPR